MMRQAVLVIDAQVGLLEGSGICYDAAGVIERIRQIIAAARTTGHPIIYIQDKDVGGVGSPEWQIVAALAPHEGDPRIEKAYADSFYQTNLQDVLAAHALQQLIVVGCRTDACVATTSQRAVSLGYDVTLVGDAHSTIDNHFMSAPQTIAYYNQILDGFGAEDGFGAGQHEIIVQSTEQVLAQFRS
jgi:nicotinamidase-related amidase